MNKDKLQQSLFEIEKALRGMPVEIGQTVDDTGFHQRDYLQSLSSIQLSLTNISSSLGGLSQAVRDGVFQLKKELHSEAMKLLQDENVRLMADITSMERKFAKYTMLLKDLASPCIGCRKAAWQPHNQNCEWAGTDELLKQLFKAVSGAD